MAHATTSASQTSRNRSSRSMMATAVAPKGIDLHAVTRPVSLSCTRLRPRVFPRRAHLLASCRGRAPREPALAAPREPTQTQLTHCNAFCQHP